MRKLIVPGLAAPVLAAGLLVVGTGPAAADSGADAGSANAATLGSGNNLNVPINAPITACGNALGVLNLVDSGCVSRGRGGQFAGASSFALNEAGIGSGNNLNVPINAPITACGNAFGVLNLVDSGCLQTGPRPAVVPIAVPSGCGDECGPDLGGRRVHRPALDNRPGLSPLPPRSAKPTTAVHTAATRAATRHRLGGLAYTGMTALAATPVGALLLVTGALVYRRSRVRTQA